MQKDSHWFHASDDQILGYLAEALKEGVPLEQKQLSSQDVHQPQPGPSADDNLQQLLKKQNK